MSVVDVSVVDVMAWLLIPAAALPVLTAIVLWFATSTVDSQALRDRWHISLVLAALGLIVGVLAANRVLGWGLDGEWLTVPFALALLAADVVSGKWLIEYFGGRYG